MDSARMAAQSDPDLNYHFRRRWSGPPMERKRPRQTGICTGATFKAGCDERDNSLSLRLLQLAIQLDRAADAELVLGHQRIAERLSRQAEELREAAL